MKLYHGTSQRAAEKIIKEGIKPRSKGKGNWEKTSTSRKDCVYMTDAYALYFAASSSKPKEDLVVFEIDTENLHPFLFLPDEDFLEQASRKNGPAPIDLSMKKRTIWYRNRLPSFSDYWEQSLVSLGTCAYMGEIPLSSITRIAKVSDKEFLQYWTFQRGYDPSIILANYAFCGEKYRRMTQELFERSGRSISELIGDSVL